MSSKKSVADSTLNKLWSQAVRLSMPCPVCGISDPDSLDAHHIIPKGRQRRFPLRWELRNGVAMCRKHHRDFHDGDLGVRERLLHLVHDRGDYGYLMTIKTIMKAEYLQYIGMSENEFRLAKKKELQEVIYAYR